MARFAFTEPKLNMTPMIDMVFLLLIFFMVATTFIRRDPDRVVKPPESSRLGDRPKAARSLVLNVRDDGVVTADQQVVPPEKLQPLIAAAEGPVVIRADGRARHAHTLRLLQACAAAGRTKVKLVVVPQR